MGFKDFGGHIYIVLKDSNCRSNNQTLLQCTKVHISCIVSAP